MSEMRNDETPSVKNRRPLATRSRALVGRLTEALLRTSVTPDQISAALEQMKEAYKNWSMR